MRKTYKFEDLVRVWKAAELNAKLTGKKWDNELSPTDYCHTWHRGRGFITLETFGKWKLLFKAMLPGLTQKNMKQILRDLRKREKEFDRRSKERYLREPDGKHRDRWNYRRTDWKDGARRHSFVKERLYPLDEYTYRHTLKKWLQRMVSDGTLERMQEQLFQKVRGDIDTYGYIRVSGNSRTLEKNVPVVKADDLARKLVTSPWTSYSSGRIGNESALRSNDHVNHTVWFAPYKTREGRAGLMLCIKLPTASNDYCWTEKVDNFIGPNARGWLYNNMLILDKRNSIIVNHPEAIEDWGDFVRCERGEEVQE